MGYVWKPNTSEHRSVEGELDANPVVEVDHLMLANWQSGLCSHTANANQSHPKQFMLKNS